MVSDKIKPLPRMRNVCLEMSLKPFRQTDDVFINNICKEAFTQWLPLLRDADEVSVLLWTADGSEILDYRAEADAPIEWARYIGSANPRWTVAGDPERKSIHARSYLYTPEPATITYAALGRIIEALKQVGHQITGLPVRVGATFDPGCEFAKSPWKYQRHNETCLANTGGPKSFMCCYAELNPDDTPYAAFPDGISANTSLGTFFGAQCREFLHDLKFDYIWFSNGFGFGLETWMTRGPVFDGRRFYPEKTRTIRDKILAFWRDFRTQCPDLRVETRGTNLGTGIDLASDGVPLRELYNGNFNFLAPPNSPWAALNRDFGLELAGYMSHIAELPPHEGYPFRFYTHDPWWKNSPWLDRYDRQPHDIYMPLSICRIDADGHAQTPDFIHFLSIDDSYGHMPVQVPNEVIPHIQEARRHGPDAPGPLVWLYPFDELHDRAFSDDARLSESFFNDWFMRSAIRNGLPLNTVISTRSFVSTAPQHRTLLAQSILITPIPDADSPVESHLLDFINSGGSVLFYGPTDRASQTLLDLLGLRHDTPVDGPAHVHLVRAIDAFTHNQLSHDMIHRSLLSGGGCSEVFTGSENHLLAEISVDTATRAFAVACPRESSRGGIAWVRGSIAADYLDHDLTSGRGHLPVDDDPSRFFTAEILMRFALADLGIHLGFQRQHPGRQAPITCIHRNANGFYFSGYVPDTTAQLQLRMPAGAPILFGCDAQLHEGRACYFMPRAWRNECRIFIDQPTDGTVTCTTMTAEQIGISRRFKVSGLQDAIVRFYPEDPDAPISIVNNGGYPYFIGPFASFTRHKDHLGQYIQTERVTGELIFSY